MLFGIWFAETREGELPVSEYPAKKSRVFRSFAALRMTIFGNQTTAFRGKRSLDWLLLVRQMRADDLFGLLEDLVEREGS